MILADPDPADQNETDPDPKHWLYAWQGCIFFHFAPKNELLATWEKNMEIFKEKARI